MNQEAVISCRDLKKSYGEHQALISINLEVSRGELFGLIGPDGAGKTSLFRILASLLIPDQGQSSVLGFDPVKEYREVRKIIGYMPGRFSLYMDLTVQENLDFYASVFGTSSKNQYHLIEDIFKQLEPFRKRRAGQLSGGMKQKLALSCAMIHQPKVLILDEPTTGVDAVSRVEFWDSLSKLKNSGVTILVSTPYMDEANRCDRIALIQQGRLLKTSTPEQLIDQYPDNLYAIVCDDRFKLKASLEDQNAIKSIHLFGQELHVTFRDEEGLRFLSEFAKNEKLEIGIKKIEPKVEDCFIQLMQ